MQMKCGIPSFLSWPSHGHAKHGQINLGGAGQTKKDTVRVPGAVRASKAVRALKGCKSLKSCKSFKGWKSLKGCKSLAVRAIQRL